MERTSGVAGASGSVISRVSSRLSLDWTVNKVSGPVCGQVHDDLHVKVALFGYTTVIRIALSSNIGDGLRYGAFFIQ